MKLRSKSKFFGDVQARQRNTVWPDTLRNGRTVDGFLWKGSSTATPVQRLGIAIFGLAFLVPAFFFAYLAVFKTSSGTSLFLILFALFWLAIACRLLGNAFRK